MGLDEQVTFAVTPWDARSEAELATIADAGEHIDTWRDAIIEGRAQLWAILSGGERVGVVLFEIVDRLSQPFIAILAAAASSPSNITNALYAAFCGLADLSNVGGVVCETMRPGLVRILSRLGCDVEEIAPGKWEIAHV